MLSLQAIWLHLKNAEFSKQIEIVEVYSHCHRISRLGLFKEQATGVHHIRSCKMRRKAVSFYEGMNWISLCF